ncbi:unnamed protein product [Soboliphyme baturini]|uniref:alpha-1,2-Mannosidase n=1 Tax=Soboliphyme baturini TaxID=241478 RepID=A0A183IRW5_9BILA|nr:unnamed protein product [Soboliphyme baturini]
MQILSLFYVLLSLDFVYTLNKTQLREQVREMFHHAYSSYMNHAYPADELMPLSCKGRYRGVAPSRGDVDDALGNFSLTLIDSLDTLMVFSDFYEFKHAVKLVSNISFDTDVVVSVFETNIRVVGGLLSGHLLAKILQSEIPENFEWYNDQLLQKAKDVASRLLPAFNTTTGIPYPRVNLKYGLDGNAHNLRYQEDTCTACAGTMILEFAALSRLTNDPVFEQKARTAMDVIWKQRNRFSDLVGSVLNVHSGDWIQRDSGVGAGIDSYYEYCLKAYVLLGDDKFLYRFNTVIIDYCRWC